MVRIIGITEALVLIGGIWWAVGWFGRRGKRRAEKALIEEIMRRWQW